MENKQMSQLESPKDMILFNTIHDISEINTRGMDGKHYLLHLRFGKYYGYNIKKEYETVEAVWSSLFEHFFETNTREEILDSDIIGWSLCDEM